MAFPAHHQEFIDAYRFRRSSARRPVHGRRHLALSVCFFIPCPRVAAVAAGAQRRAQGSGLSQPFRADTEDAVVFLGGTGAVPLRRGGGAAVRSGIRACGCRRLAPRAVVPSHGGALALRAVSCSGAIWIRLQREPEQHVDRPRSARLRGAGRTARGVFLGSRHGEGAPECGGWTEHVVVYRGQVQCPRGVGACRWRVAGKRLA